jgi:membrane fusion protein, multidrug efflux system
MPTEKSQSADEDASSSVTASPTDGPDVTARDADKARSDAPSGPNAPIGHQPIRRRLLLGGAAVLLLAVILGFGIPWFWQTLNTVSTDDAFVNGHVTFVAARVPGQVSRVLVDDNNTVHKGEHLVELDKEPYETAVAVKSAAVDIAKANLELAEASVRSVEAKARSQYRALQKAMEDVQNGIALLHAKVAALDKNKATLKFAQEELDRAKALVSSSRRA